MTSAPNPMMSFRKSAKVLSHKVFVRITSSFAPVVIRLGCLS